VSEERGGGGVGGVRSVASLLGRGRQATPLHWMVQEQEWRARMEAAAASSGLEPPGMSAHLGGGNVTSAARTGRRPHRDSAGPSDGRQHRSLPPTITGRGTAVDVTSPEFTAVTVRGATESGVMGASGAAAVGAALSHLPARPAPDSGPSTVQPRRDSGGSGLDGDDDDGEEEEEDVGELGELGEDGVEAIAAKAGVPLWSRARAELTARASSPLKSASSSRQGTATVTTARVGQAASSDAGSRRASGAGGSGGGGGLSVKFSLPAAMSTYRSKAASDAVGGVGGGAGGRS